LELTGLNRFVGASFGTQQQVNRHVEEALVTYQHEETARLAEQRPPKDITMTQDETFTGGLCLVGMEPVSNSIVLEQTAQARYRSFHLSAGVPPPLGLLLLPPP
jgi:hypothetical protein